MHYPDWVEKYKKKGTSVKKIGDSYYLYSVTSEREKGRKYPISRQRYIGKITENGIEKVGIRIIPEETEGKVLGDLVPSVDKSLRKVVLIKTEEGWMYTKVSDDSKAKFKELGLYEYGLLSKKREC